MCSLQVPLNRIFVLQALWSYISLILTSGQPTLKLERSVRPLSTSARADELSLSASSQTETTAQDPTPSQKVSIKQNPITVLRSYVLTIYFAASCPPAESMENNRLLHWLKQSRTAQYPHGLCCVASPSESTGQIQLPYHTGSLNLAIQLIYEAETSTSSFQKKKKKEAYFRLVMLEIGFNLAKKSRTLTSVATLLREFRPLLKFHQHGELLIGLQSSFTDSRA